MSAAIITPTYRNDLAIVRALCASVDRFVAADIHHHLVVPRGQYRLFADLNGPRRTVTPIEAVLPRGFVKLPLPARLPLSGRAVREWWMAPGRWRVSGWIIQQIVKLSADRVCDADLLLFIDSDVRLLRPLDTALFRHGDVIRFVHKPGLGADQPAQAAWGRVVGRLLGIAPRDYYGADYVGNIVSWRRDTMLRLQARIAQVTGLAWQVAIAREPLFSEYLAYGVFIDHVEPDAGHARTPESLTLNSWNYALSQAGEAARFVADWQPHHIGVLLQSTERLSPDARERIIAALAARA
ncbi:DUF6492 family protein [Sphingomonas sp. NFR15]|uniref:DUF6492 family protein n=1 Tax=Sphingomonas sp. NFR15 TaxID=1566282 RepID=UPI00088AA7A3|nr:DUF6492 family protein [Sphingomonas sp. NFR15]SDA36721.1 hypothetical protein SAMN03159340_03824 [Sphingomonas sp. NFR15]